MEGDWILIDPVFTRLCEAGVVLQTTLSLIDQASHPFPPNLQNSKPPKPLEQGT